MNINRVKISEKAPTIIIEKEGSKISVEFELLESGRTKSTYKGEKATELHAVYSLKGNKDAIIDISFYGIGFAVKNMLGESANKQSLSIPDDILSEIPSEYLHFIVSKLMESEKVSVKLVSDNINKQYGICPMFVVFDDGEIRDDIPEQFGAYEYKNNRYYAIAV